MISDRPTQKALEMTYLLIEDCPVCHSKNRDIYYKGTAGNHLNKTMDFSNYACTTSSYGRYFDLMKCRDCQLIYTSVQPSAKTLEAAYSSIEDHIYFEEENGRAKTFSRVLQDLNRFCPLKGQMFEFGSYTGVFLEMAQKDGWKVDGIELSHWARKVALNKRGISLRESLELIAPGQHSAYDSVVIWDVIEHVPDPLRMIKQVANLLKPGGVLGLSTIMLDSLSARLLGKKYPFLMEMHVIYFTHKTLLDLLEQCGFEILEYKRHSRFVSYLYLLSRIKQMAFVYNNPRLANVLKKQFVQLSAGLRDVYARKKLDH